MATDAKVIKKKAQVLMSNAKRRCNDKGVELHLHHEWVEKHLERGTCELTGIPFSFDPPSDGVSRRPDAPSLDRISKHKHYTEDNTRVILWAVNCALAEYGTQVMLPILKAMVKGIENAQALSVTSLPAGNYQQGKIYPELGPISTPGTREDCYDLDHYQRTVRGEDSDYRTQKSGGDSVGCGSSKVATSTPFKSVKDNWHLNPTYGWLEY